MGILRQLQFGVMPKQFIFAAIIAVMNLIWTNLATGQSTPRCLSYEPTVVTLSGTLVRKTFPGPPNYESIRKGGRPETSWFLDLSESLCVNESATEPDLNPKQIGVREIQLVVKPDQYQQHKGLVGRKVLATGTLFGEHTGHHRTPVLLTLRTLDEAPKSHQQSLVGL